MVPETKTVGDGCSVALFVNVNVTTHAFPNVSPPDEAVSTSCPGIFVQTPVLPKRPYVDVTGKRGVSSVCAPVSPEIVTVDPFGRL